MRYLDKIVKQIYDLLKIKSIIMSVEEMKKITKVKFSKSFISGASTVIDIAPPKYTKRRYSRYTHVGTDPTPPTSGVESDWSVVGHTIRGAMGKIETPYGKKRT